MLQDATVDRTDDGCLSYSTELNASESSSVECHSMVCQTDHHIVYSHSYCVPVMYFNIYRPGVLHVSMSTDRQWPNTWTVRVLDMLNSLCGRISDCHPS
jgi:Autophagocytosis associated protein, active-site domain